MSDIDFSKIKLTQPSFDYTNDMISSIQRSQEESLRAVQKAREAKEAEELRRHNELVAALKEAGEKGATIVLGNRSKTLLLPIICKSTDLPTASRLRSEGTSLKSHRLNIYNGIVPSNANIPDPIREPPAPIAKSFNTFSDFFIRPSSSFLSKASSVFWIILFTFSVLSPNVC